MLAPVTLIALVDLGAQVAPVPRVGLMPPMAHVLILLLSLLNIQSCLSCQEILKVRQHKLNIYDYIHT